MGWRRLGVPIMIHLLNRRKYREVPWAAMRFLMAAIRKNRGGSGSNNGCSWRSGRWWSLLVVSAMAKPFLESLRQRCSRAGAPTGCWCSTASLEHGLHRRGVTRFDQAKALAAQLVKDSRRGDAISMILMGDPPRVVIGDPSPNLVEVQKEIEELALRTAARTWRRASRRSTGCSRSPRSARRKWSS